MIFKKRRHLLKSLSAVSGLGFLGVVAQKFFFKEKTMTNSLPVIQKRFPIGFQWQTQEPFLFCVHHYDYFPQGNGQWGPEKDLLKGRDIGQDFTPKDGFRMYHGKEIPGFPVHPHRGFETITIVRKGYVDHADSMGAAGRYGQGDVQWMTAGGGVQHSEMFPLLNTDSPNTLELFQVWLNLPKASKMVAPHFKMLWSEKIPKIQIPEQKAEVTLIAGEYANQKPPPPPPNSWAANPESETLILLIKLQPNGMIELPVTPKLINRAAYFFLGKGLEVNGQQVEDAHGFVLDSTIKTTLRATDSEVEVLLLQSKSIGEPVVQYGPFVMNTKEEIVQTIQDYQQSQFGGWPWERDDMVHGEKIERFAKRPDGQIERPEVNS